MGNVIPMPGLLEATIHCGHCGHLWSGVLRFAEAVFQCPECASMSGRVVADLKKVSG
jgi:Zn finger protein HypA/HybF involved in hydrogenase expression